MLHGDPVLMPTVKGKLGELIPAVGTTPAATEIGRLIQIINAFGCCLGGE